MVASSQPLAVEAAIHVLRNGGNAIDAAVTATAMLSVVEPMSTGLGGDCFALMYIAKEHRLFALNGSGRAPSYASADDLIRQGLTHIPAESPHSVTVPGALHGLVQCLERFGTITLDQVLAPAIECAEGGFPVSELAAQQWSRAACKLSRHAESARVYLPHGRAPRPGEVFRNPDLAHTLRRIAHHGIAAFYHGDIGQAIAASVQHLGGSLTLNDLQAHRSDWVEPITTCYRGHDVVELPPNTQGLLALMALNIVEGFPLTQMGHHSVDYLHSLIEAMKLALTDAQTYIADPDEPLPLSKLISKSYAQTRRTQIYPTQPLIPVTLPPYSGDTAYVAVVDEQRNVVSMISSAYKLFGAGITVPGTGLVLQNRGACFTLEPNHPNRLGPGKRPYHTIIPAMMLRKGRPWACFGIVGGMMQAQAHLQVISNLVDFDMNPQAALDAPRFRILESGQLALEKGITADVQKQLAARGHRLTPNAAEEGFGGGQLIIISNDVLLGASDPRKDGCAIGY